MGLIRGSATFSRYRIEGGLPDDYAEVFPKGILRYAFRNLDDLPNEERSTGWVNILDIFDSSFAAMEYFKDPYLALSWRVDVKKIPARALYQYALEAENEVKQRENLAFLPKTRREEIKEMVRLKLLKRAIPQSNVYDVIWNLQTGDLLFGGTSNKLCDEFVEIFRNTFERLPIPVYPYARARRLFEMAKQDPGAVDDIKPLVLAEEAVS